MTVLRSITFATLTLFAGCSHPNPKVTVDVLDTSLSITPHAERDAESAIFDQISRLGRGDRLILIPITGDAQNDAGGRILRLVAPSERQAYDNDLRRFQANAKKQYTAWIASLDPHQMRTDILGTLDVARQEFSAVPENANRRLIILSDFLEDDPGYRFVSSPQLANAGRARALAVVTRTDRRFALPGVPVCLGRLESSDFAPLSPQRKEAVQAFWAEYLNDRGQAPALRFDGTGMLTGDSECYDGSKDAAAGRAGRGGSSSDRGQIAFRVGWPRGVGRPSCDHHSCALRNGGCGEAE